MAPEDTVSLKEYVDTVIRLTTHAFESQTTAIREATELAKDSMEKRLDGMNEFRSTLKDQSSQFVTRKEFITVVISLVTIGIALLVALKLNG